MTIDEKLQHFYEVSLDEAREDAAKAIQDHKAYLEQVLEEHKQSRRHRLPKLKSKLRPNMYEEK